MDVTIAVFGEGREDELRSLQSLLSDEDLLRGRVRLVSRPPEPGALGPVAELLQISLGPGGAVTALSGVLIAWLHQRRGSVEVRATREGERVSIELLAKHVQGMDATALRRQILELERALDSGDGDTEGADSPIRE